ncbi:slit homolog 3 protein-like [Argiope bruennichi]|uniref:slit homolog 3 protein-like n=1 Tax=Argiope bruennichi TaxID=94029 RepID=UPI0024959CFB|nr:slit homolog 3 protein-like [Argiope bruennichi]
MFSILCLFLSVVWSVMGQCPPAEDIAPHCICKDLGDGPMLLCEKIMSAEQLIPIIKSTDTYPMFALTLMDSTLLYIPSNLFKNTKYEKIRFVNTQLMSLSDGDLAFEGLEDLLEEIRATDAHYITQWDWSQLRNQRALRLIDVNLIELHTLDQEFPALESLRTLGISKADISFIHPTAFSSLKNLELLILRDNSISDLSRSMFPSPSNHLTIINLSNNQLSSLPDGLFDNMPNLSDLDLSYNKFAALSEEAFLWPLEHLQTLTLTGNPIRCDCRMRWIVDVKKPMYFQAYCSQPDNLKDVSLDYITKKSLWC